uniref:Secreted protein n=1 Tax=Picea glauca TaxID=3330 RepID=A0A101LZ35_PICGL|nr:hypothetical protein ABT39_MTgene5011 [Picea glauca]
MPVSIQVLVHSMLCFFILEFLSRIHRGGITCRTHRGLHRDKIYRPHRGLINLSYPSRSYLFPCSIHYALSTFSPSTESLTYTEHKLLHQMD